MSETTAEYAARFRADMARARRRQRQRSGVLTVRLSFTITADARRVLTERMWRRDLQVTRDGLATEACIEQWARDLIFDQIDDQLRIDECVRLNCADTDDDHDHMDGPKGYER